MRIYINLEEQKVFDTCLQVIQKDGVQTLNEMIEFAMTTETKPDFISASIAVERFIELMEDAKQYWMERQMVL
jgi:hypothetical protein